MCLNLELFFFRVSSLAYPNLLGKKGYVVVVVVVVFPERIVTFDGILRNGVFSMVFSGSSNLSMLQN